MFDKDLKEITFNDKFHELKFTKAVKLNFTDTNL